MLGILTKKAIYELFKCGSMRRNTGVKVKRPISFQSVDQQLRLELRIGPPRREEHKVAFFIGEKCLDYPSLELFVVILGRVREGAECRAVFPS